MSCVYWHQMWKRRCETGLGLRGRYKSAFYLQYCFFVDNSNDPSISNYWFGSRMIWRIRQRRESSASICYISDFNKTCLPTSMYVYLLYTVSISIALLLCSLRLWRGIHSDEKWITVLELKLIELPPEFEWTQLLFLINYFLQRNYFRLADLFFQ